VYLWTVSDLAAAARLYMSVGFVQSEVLTHEVWGVTLTEQRYDLHMPR
jgi:hypothetical protein